MKYLLYARENSIGGKLLQQDICKVLPQEHLRTVHTLEKFFRVLRQPGDRPCLVFLLASGRQELDTALEQRELLLDITLILILPDRDMDTIALGHALMPRYITYADRGFADLQAVLANMVSGRYLDQACGQGVKS